MGAAVNLWTKEEDAFLIANVTDFTYRQISEKMVTAFPGTPGRSRNSIISRAHRLLLNSNPSMLKAARALRDARAAQVRIASPIPAPPKVRGWPKPMTETGILFFDMPAFGKCRMPLWGDDDPISRRYFCGADCAPERTYCPGCHALAFEPRTIRKATAA